ncbi:hypothetical protein N6H14_32605 [Paenibacillus sp. CC-CFT747]|nr:hypothetical protein N6H14_32605 [Paenibacillus sp. CC-CFT747]
MDKRTYYVAVGPGDIIADKGAMEYNFEIEATDDELDKLQELFEDTDEAETRNAHWAMLPFSDKGHDEQNDLYDHNLEELYRMLHELGTPETKAHIESMKILDSFNRT